MATIGYESIGALNSRAFVTDEAAAQKIKMPSDGSIEKITFYGKDWTGGGNAKPCIWAWSSGNGTKTLIYAGTGVVITSVDGWQELAFDSPVLVTKGTYYYIGCIFEEDHRIYYDTGASQYTSEYGSDNNYSSPAGLDVNTHIATTNNVSIYATYTAIPDEPTDVGLCMGFGSTWE